MYFSLPSKTLCYHLRSGFRMELSFKSPTCQICTKFLNVVDYTKCLERRDFVCLLATICMMNQSSVEIYRICHIIELS